jgi:hypothetical protein
VHPGLFEHRFQMKDVDGCFVYKPSSLLLTAARTRPHTKNVDGKLGWLPQAYAPTRL